MRIHCAPPKPSQLSDPPLFLLLFLRRGPAAAAAVRHVLEPGLQQAHPGQEAGVAAAGGRNGRRRWCVHRRAAGRGRRWHLQRGAYNPRRTATRQKRCVKECAMSK